jgi:hypothetical protein
MIFRVRPTNRLFSRRLLLLCSSPRVASKQTRALGEISGREFLTIGHFMAYGEPARFELSVGNVFGESWDSHRSVNS